MSPRPRLQLRLAEELLADKGAILKRLTPHPGAGNRNLSDLLRGPGSTSSTGAAGQGRGGPPVTDGADRAEAAPRRTDNGGPGEGRRDAGGSDRLSGDIPPGARGAASAEGDVDNNLEDPETGEPASGRQRRDSDDSDDVLHPSADLGTSE